ncbi:MAG: alpha-1,2-fucosyltransferase [bacterium]
MITVNLKGGMGNQMFQYATARHLSIKYDSDLILNTEYFYNIPHGDVPRKYQLDIFNIKKNIKLKQTINPIVKILQKISLKIFSEKTQTYIAFALLNFNLPVYLNGYFQSEKYFKNDRVILLKEFTLTKEIGTEARKIKEVLEKSESVCLNVRRGDYLRPDYIKIFGTCDIEYYNRAMEYIKNKVKNPLICVFSDDPEWVKKEFKIENVIFAGNDILKDYEQMYLMSICKHNIIANSSFAWWGAWLNQNPNKIIIGPKKWLANKTSDKLDVLPKEWIQI